MTSSKRKRGKKAAFNHSVKRVVRFWKHIKTIDFCLYFCRAIEWSIQSKRPLLKILWYLHFSLFSNTHIHTYTEIYQGYHTSKDLTYSHLKYLLSVQINITLTRQQLQTGNLKGAIAKQGKDVNGDSCSKQRSSSIWKRLLQVLHRSSQLRASVPILFQCKAFNWFSW